MTDLLSSPEIGACHNIVTSMIMLLESAEPVLLVMHWAIKDAGQLSPIVFPMETLDFVLPAVMDTQSSMALAKEIRFPIATRVEDKAAIDALIAIIIIIY